LPDGNPTAPSALTAAGNTAAGSAR